MAYAFGNFITEANIDGKGWRWVFWIAAIPGFVLGILMLFTLKEPARSEKGDIQVYVSHLTLLNIKEQILLSCLHTFLIKVLWRSYIKLTLGDHIFLMTSGVE